MRTSRLTASVAAASLLAGCFGGGGANSAGPTAPGAVAIDRKAPETFAFTPAQNRHLKIEVFEALLQGAKGYLPKDRNWVQLRVNVTNVSGRTLQLTEVKTRLADGTVLAGARTGHDLAEPPSFSGVAGKQLGIGVAGQMAGMFIFPPLALVAGGFGLFNMLGGQEKWSKRVKRIDSGLLRPQDIAPGTSVSGYVFVPAVRGQTGLIAFYELNGKSESLPVARSAS